MVYFVYEAVEEDKTMVVLKKIITDTKMFKPLLVVGARPNIMKMAPLYHAFRKRDNCNPLVLHTGQHYDHEMSGSFFQQFELPPPNYQFDIQNRDRTGLVQEVETKTIEVIREIEPDCMIVFGDVNSTLGAARAAKHEDLTLIHVEAGLRSGDLGMPEELNRIETDRISDLLFLTEQSAVDHLKKEDVSPWQCHFVGNTMIDTLLKYKSKVTRKIDEDYILWTVHRPANVDNEKNLLKMIRLLEHACQDLLVVWPLHPRTKLRLEKYKIWKHVEGMKNLKLLRPQDYLSFLSWMKYAQVVVTDSGGVQEECCVLKVPCITLRKSTERPVTLEGGANQLVPVLDLLIFEKAMSESIKNSRDWQIPALWDGATGERIVDIIMNAYQDAWMNRGIKLELDQPKVIS